MTSKAILLGETPTSKVDGHHCSVILATREGQIRQRDSTSLYAVRTKCHAQTGCIQIPWGFMEGDTTLKKNRIAIKLRRGKKGGGCQTDHTVAVVPISLRLRKHEASNQSVQSVSQTLPAINQRAINQQSILGNAFFGCAVTPTPAH